MIFKLVAKFEKIVQNKSMQVTYDKNSIIINGKREFIRSGAFHYFRSPGEEIALDRFKKLKSGGYNTVDIYFNWNYHSKAPGEYDFSGIKDVRKVLDAAKEVGLFVIARPGPFINAEVNAGGLPFWLLKDKDVIPRNRVGTEYQYSTKYMQYINEWYDQIIPIIVQYDNIIAFQIENEYATDDMDEAYMRELYQMARDRGITCPIFHNDAYCAGLWADVVDIYACDVYPYINPNQNWKQDHFCFDTLDNLEDMVRMSKEDAPLFIAEMQGGWFDKWDGIGYSAMRAALGDGQINIVTKTAISQGVTMFNHYMAIGGTSWDDLACDEVYTSYEFTAGIDEYGSIHPNFHKAKAINYFLNSFGLANTDPCCDPVFEQEVENVYSKRRRDNENNCNWLFVRNMNTETVELSVGDINFNLQPFDMKIIPEKLELYACMIDFSDVEIFARLKNDKDEVLFMIAEEGTNIYLDVNDEKVVISGTKNDYENIKLEKDGKTTQFLFISKALADKTWVVDDTVIFNADFVYSNKRIAISKTTEVAYYDLTHGFSKKYFKYQQDNEVQELKDFDISFCAPEIDTQYDYSNWDCVHTEDYTSLDSLSIGKYDEFVWYKAKIPNTLEEITLSARHLFAVYINGKEVLNRNSYKYEKLQQIAETISIPLDNTILTKTDNELTILVQNIGFDKGFSGETNNPRGLVTFETKPESKIKFYVNDKLSFERADYRESESPYFTKLSATFDVDIKENVFFSKYISLKDFPYDRATIFLNGVKIGRYLRNAQDKSLQENFYLINTCLKPKNTIEIVVWEKASNIKTPWGFKFDIKRVIIQVGYEKICQIY